jgi:folate-binding protein YgfZ
MTDCRVALLPDRGVVEIEGPDATEFLQDLVTNDVELERMGEAAFAALLNPQGRILFDFFAIRRGAQSYWLDCARSRAADLAKRLSLYKLRAKITVTDRSAEFAVAARWGDCPALAEGAALACYADPRYAPLGSRLIAGAKEAKGLAARLGALEASEADYAAHRVALAIPQGGLDYVYGEALPHEAAFDELHGVDFEKGCYVGQEVVSRMHHLGTAKTRIAAVEFAEVPGGDALAPGCDILAGDLPVGRLGSVAGTKGIAVIRLDRAAEALGQGISLRAGGVVLTARQPPWAKYSVPGL